MNKNVILDFKELQRFSKQPRINRIYNILTYIEFKIKTVEKLGYVDTDLIRSSIEIYKYLENLVGDDYKFPELDFEEIFGDDILDWIYSVVGEATFTLNSLVMKKIESEIDISKIENDTFIKITEEDKTFLTIQIDELIDDVKTSDYLGDEIKDRLVDKLNKIKVEVEEGINDFDSLIGFAFEAQHFTENDPEVKAKVKLFVKRFFSKVNVEKASAAYSLIEGAVKLLS